MIRKLHHNAYRCRDSERTRQFYEDFLGLPMVGALDLSASATGRPVNALHTFFRMDDGSHLAFFEVPDSAFEFKDQHDFDLHIALEVDEKDLKPMLDKGKQHGIDTRGPSNHGMIESIYFRDPDGYVIELCAKRANHDDLMDPAKNKAHDVLKNWVAKRNG